MKIQQSVSFEENEHNKVTKLAKDNERSFSWMVAQLVKEALKQREKK